MRTIMIGMFVSAALLCSAIAVVEAQTQGGARHFGTEPSGAGNGQTQPAAPNDDESTAPRQEPQSGTGAARGSLSHELSRSGGVIQTAAERRSQRRRAAKPGGEPHARHSAARHPRRKPAG